jgi:hypothetical protein
MMPVMEIMMPVMVMRMMFAASAIGTDDATTNSLSGSGALMTITMPVESARQTTSI